MDKAKNKTENHFNAIFSQKQKVDYVFNPKKMGSKDRKIVGTLQKFGIKGKKCLDIGPGTGRWLSFLKKEGASYLAAIDLSSEALDRCCSICDQVQKADLETEHFAFDSDCFDIIISFEVLEHLKNPEPYLAEIKRVVKQNGIIMMSLPNIISLISRIRMCLGLMPVAIASDITHVRFYRQQEIVKLFKKFGFKTEFIPTSISFNPFNPKSRLSLRSVDFLSSFDDSLLFIVRRQ